MAIQHIKVEGESVDNRVLVAVRAAANGQFKMNAKLHSVIFLAIINPIKK